VNSGSLDAVKVLVGARAERIGHQLDCKWSGRQTFAFGTRDKAYQATPLGWAEHAAQDGSAMSAREGMPRSPCTFAKRVANDEIPAANLNADVPPVAQRRAAQGVPVEVVGNHGLEGGDQGRRLGRHRFLSMLARGRFTPRAESSR
jgi:hypothetical protein